MRQYLARRLAWSFVTLFAAIVLVFVAARLLPGDPVVALTAEDADPAVRAAMRERLGLDGSWWSQFADYFGGIMHGDLGTSVKTNRPVTSMIADALPPTIQLAVMSMLVAIVIGVGSGFLAAVRQGTIVDKAASTVALVGLSVPTFWLGLMGIFVFAVTLGWLPAGGYTPMAVDPADSISRMLMPAIALGTALSAVIMRQTRVAMLSALDSDYVRMARSQGLGRFYAQRLALRNGLVVVTTIVGLQLGGLLSGAVVTEQVFAIPGFGKLVIDSVFNRDYPIIQGVLIFTALAYVLINFITDLVYCVLDPRITVTEGAH